MKSYITKTIFFTILFAASTLAVQAHRTTDANIHGHVLDKKTQEHIPHATIKVKGMTVGAVADATGHYRINNLPVGAPITLIATFVGYEPQEIEITKAQGQTIEVNFELK